MHVMQLLSLKNKVVLVTGGAGRYGKCIVEGCAEAQGTVVTASRNLQAGQEIADTMRARGLDVHALHVDQGDHESVLALKQSIEQQFGGLHIFVNNAVLRPLHGYASPLSEWEQSMRVNAIGMFDIIREMADLIAGQGGGSIVNIGSMMGMFGPDLSNYEGTDLGDPPPDYFFHKGGVIGLTHYLARVLADKQIRANCISPGGLLAEKIQPKAFLANYTKKVPVGRMANNDDIKGLVVFLASEASAYVNGENILMDGGMHC